MIDWNKGRQYFFRNLKNIPGWCTHCKIIVIESDDWGSVYMPAKGIRDKLISRGFDFSNNHYLNFDCLESNVDLEMLFEVLSKHKDSTGRNPVFTGVSVIANPDFEKIKANGILHYEYELYTETCKKYKGRERVYELWKEGIRERLIMPVFHGREHLNVQRWMKLLLSDNKIVKTVFEYGISCISLGPNKERLPDLRAAFDIDNISDLEYLKEVINTGLDHFERLYGFNARYFVPANGPFNSSLESVLNNKGIRYIGTGKINREPVGNKKYKKRFRCIGEKNNFGQTYLTRNCFFEPSSFERSDSWDWLSTCLKEIETAFRWRKPAIISSHRVNYVGSIDPDNRARSLKKLHILLSLIIKKWPDVIFLTSVELGDLINNELK